LLFGVSGDTTTRNLPEVSSMTHAAFAKDSVALITGGAGGIGLAAAKKFAALEMRICIADIGAERLKSAKEELFAAGAKEVMTSETDVSLAEELTDLEANIRKHWGGVDVLMNNAGIGPKSSTLMADNWQEIIDVNLWGVIYGVQAFVPGMLARNRPGVIINTGSKQGITTPPGNPAYNVSKAALKAYTEALQHELRNTKDCKLSARLLIPGFVFTGMTAGGRSEKPAGAWTPEQTVDFMMERLSAGDFYILCPDNDVPRSLDEKRIQWAAQDIIENRPPLSRWHPEYADAFAAFIKK
jgi:NAD(P)-dependent dehydrogenase (short-subunit alcohol dehydrogenase family)